MTLFDVLPIGILAAIGAGVGKLFGNTLAGMSTGFVTGLLLVVTGTHYRLLGWLARGEKDDQSR